MRSCKNARSVAYVLSTGAAVALAIALASRSTGFAQSPTYGVGRPPTPEEIKAWDITVGPSGRELPAGSGTVQRGQTVYAEKCARCHGATGKEGPQGALAGGIGTLKSPKPLKTVGSYWPYATTLFDYINRAMPFDRPGTLSVEEVYSSAAYVLFLNGLVGEREVIDANALRRLKMPNRDGFVPDARPDVVRNLKGKR